MTVRQKRAIAASLSAIGVALVFIALPIALLAYLGFEDRLERESVALGARASIWDSEEGNLIVAAIGGFGAGVVCLLSGSSWRRKAVEPRPFVPDPLRHLGARQG
jgi:ABC-type lipoprotein release transport system permease subunit